MKKFTYLCAALATVAAMSSCEDENSYADKLKRENNAIKEYISQQKITTISEEQFKSQNNTTDVSKNEYVRFSNSGVYMQIVDEGTGEKVKTGETVNALARFDEVNLLTKTLQLSNRNLLYSDNVDKFSVTKTSGTYTGSFDTSSSLMYRSYHSAAVPTGWLVAMPYINLGRQTSATSKPAHIKLIVPSQQGTLVATQNVAPMFYDIILLRGL